MKRKIICMAALPVSVILFSACGPPSGDAAADAVGGAPTAVATVADSGRPALETAVRAYSAAYLTGEGSIAYGLLSDRCQQRIGEAEFTGLTRAAQAQYGGQPIQTLTVDTLAGPLARVTYTYSASAINQQAEPWVFEKGSWHQDDC